MTQVNTQLPAVLRRRAKELQGEYAEPFITAIRHAADEIEMRRACESDLERTAVDAMADNRRLRKVLERVIQWSESANLSKAERRELRSWLANTISATRELGKGRRFLSIEIGEDADRDAIIAVMTARVDEYFQFAREKGERS